MQELLYLECYSGISGDMTVGALLDLGADEQVLRDALKSLPLTGYEVVISRVLKSGIMACDFDVRLEEDNHDHDMAYLHGEGEEHPHHHEDHDHHHHDHEDHDHHHHHHDHEEHEHHHHDHDEHDHDHHHHHHHDHEEHEHHHHDHAHDHHHPHDHAHPHVHRGLAEIYAIIDGGELTPGARELSKKIFQVIAQAESKAHALPVEKVHFHEVGAVDSIVDIVAVAVCIDNLGVRGAVVPALYEGQGTVRCQHGLLPVPVPAVVNIVTEHQLPLVVTGVKGELVTPTGAAIAAALRTQEKLPESFRVVATGVGAGKRSYETPGMLRIHRIVAEEKKSVSPKAAGAEPEGGENYEGKIIKLETNLDDCSGEALGFLMDALFEAGARDVSYVSCQMKKNRPGVLLSVICLPEDLSRMEELIFLHTTTVGIRRVAMDRTVLKRSFQEVSTRYGVVRVKAVALGEKTRLYPEYECVARICREQSLPFQEVFREILSSCRQ